MLQPAHSSRLDLADMFPRHPINLVGPVEGFRLAAGEPETYRDRTRLSFGEGVRDVVELLLQQDKIHRVRGYDSLGVPDEVAGPGVTILAGWGVQGDGFASVLSCLDDLPRDYVEFLRQPLRG